MEPLSSDFQFPTSSDARIPFNRAAPEGNGLFYIVDALRNMHISGDGPFTKRCQQLLEEELQSQKVLLTTSCTHALEISAQLLDLSPHSEVIVPSFTFVSTASAFARAGARLVFCDIRSDTMNLDETLLPGLVTENTKAIVPVHYAGVGCEMDSITQLAEKESLTIIEDNAHGLFGKYKGKPLGSFGALATLSFHETKNFSCGEGGALVINDPDHIATAEIIREKGTDRSRFMRGEVQKYTWVNLGSSYLPSDLLAAFLFGQLEQAQSIQARRRAVWERYFEALGPWSREHGVQLPTVPEHVEQAYHMFYLVMPNAESRSRFIDHMSQRNIYCVFHYQPLHQSEMGSRLAQGDCHCPVTEKMATHLVRLPFFTTLEKESQNRTIDAVLEFSP
ncbi:MAG: dTDP-4-amino-4,6-dideoxygalactose transaminase [Verrucomicrobiota bacterium]